MSATEILNNLQQNKLSPVYFLQGAEPYFIDQVCNFLENNILNESERGFNLIVLYGKDVAMHEVLTHARRFPMMAERQVVIVKEAHLLKDFEREEGRALLENYLDNPQPTTVLAFCYKYGKLNGNLKLAKKLKKQAVVFTSEPIKDWEVSKWVGAYLRDKGYKADEMALQLIADHIGNNLERLTNEIDKMLLNLPTGTVVNPEIVEKHIGVSREYNVFELNNALLKKDATKAYRIVQYFGANPKDNHPLRVLPVLYRLFVQLLQVHYLHDRSDSTVARTIGVPAFIARQYVQALGRYPLGKVLRNIQHLHHTDLVLKGVEQPKTSEGYILKELVYKLLH